MDIPRFQRLQGVSRGPGDSKQTREDRAWVEVFPYGLARDWDGVDGEQELNHGNLKRPVEGLRDGQLLSIN